MLAYSLCQFFFSFPRRADKDTSLARCRLESRPQMILLPRPGNRFPPALAKAFSLTPIGAGGLDELSIQKVTKVACWLQFIVVVGVVASLVCRVIVGAVAVVVVCAATTRFVVP